MSNRIDSRRRFDGILRSDVRGINGPLRTDDRTARVHTEGSWDDFVLCAECPREIRVKLAGPL